MFLQIIVEKRKQNPHDFTEKLLPGVLPVLLFSHSETHMFIDSQKKNRTENTLKSLIWKPPTAYVYAPMTDNVLSIPLQGRLSFTLKEHTSLHREKCNTLLF